MKNNFIQKDLVEIKRAAETNRDENYRFRSFLKMTSRDVDRIVHRINDEVVKQIDCTECGNCCTCMYPSVSKSEIVRLSEIKNLTEESFVEKYLEYDESEGLNFMKNEPCIFLENKKCTVYEDRPEDCRSFPHIHKKGFTGRTLGMINNYGICPIVYNVMERLKMELNFM